MDPHEAADLVQTRSYACEGTGLCKWLSLAALCLPASEVERCNNATSVREVLASKMTRAQLEEAQKLAGEWKPKIANAPPHGAPTE